MIQRFLGALLFLALMTVLGGCGSDDSDRARNTPPLSNAGPDQNVTTGSLVTLDGSASSDVNGDLLSFSWSLISLPAGSSAVLSSASAVRPTFTADVDGAYVFQLIVHDGNISSAADSVTVTAATANSAPVAEAGPNQNVTTGSLVILDGSGSSDVNGDSLSYGWSFVSRPVGSNATLSSAAAVGPTFTADLPGAYVLQLIVSDGSVDSAADTVTISAATANSAPVADAGPDQNVTTGSLVTLDGSGSSDADSDALSYNWSFLTRPSGSTASLSDPTAPNPAFTPDAAGDYVLQLIVNDGNAESDADTMTVSAENPPRILSGVWGAAETVQADVGYNNRFPRAAVNSAGDAVVSWSQGNPNFENATIANLLDSSGVWGDSASTLSIGAGDPSGGSASSPGIDDAGQVMVAREVVPDVGPNKVMVYRFNPLSALWDSGTAMVTAPEMSVSCDFTGGPSLNARYPQLQMNGAGKGVVAWENLCVSSFGWYTNIYASLYDPGTGAWSPGGRLDNYFTHAYSPTAAIGDSGQAAVGWLHRPPEWGGGAAEGLYAAVFNVADSQWTSTMLAPVVTGSGSIGEVVLCVDADGHVTTVWTQGLHLFWARYDAGAKVWSPPARLDSATITADQLAIACDGQGNVLFTWRQSEGASTFIMGRRYAASGAVWEPPVAISGSSSGLFNGGIGADEAGNAVAIYVADMHLYAQRFTGHSAGWAAPERLDIYDSAVDGQQVDLAVSASGETLVTWMQSPDNAGLLRPLVFSRRLE